MVEPLSQNQILPDSYGHEDRSDMDDPEMGHPYKAEDSPAKENNYFFIYKCIISCSPTRKKRYVRLS